MRRKYGAIAGIRRIIQSCGWVLQRAWLLWEELLSHKKRAVARVGLFVALTLLTQIGGFCYLLGLAVGRRRRVGLLAAIASYVVLTALVVPPLAQRFGRVRLPCFANGSSDVVAATSLTCVLNRGYVRPQVYALITTLGSEVRRRFPGSQVTTLEAGRMDIGRGDSV